MRGGIPLSWPLARHSNGIGAILPGMRNYLLLDAPDVRRLVIAIKFAAILRPGRFGHDRLGNGHFYQIYVYLPSQEQSGPAWKSAVDFLFTPWWERHCERE